MFYAVDVVEQACLSVGLSTSSMYMEYHCGFSN